MASCVKCGAVLIAQARFCAACGSPVTHGSVAPPAASPKPATASVPDPFAQTVLGDSASPAVAALNAQLAQAQAQPVSPLAASRSSGPPQGLTAPQAGASAQAAQNPHPSSMPPARAPQFSAPQAPPTAVLAPGTLVLVYWANGQRYPGTVLHASPQHVFVAFPNGLQQWIDVRYVTVGP